MQGLMLYLLLVKGVTLLAGTAIIYYTIRAALRTGDRGLWLLALGLIAAGLGIQFAGTLPMLVSIDPTVDLALTGSLSAIGLILVVISMSSDVPVPG